MSGDSLARSIVQTPSYSDSPKGGSGYEAYHEAVLSSERGRSFLAEHERRQRQADSAAILAAIAQIEALLRDERAKNAAKDAERNAERDVEDSTQSAAPPLPQADVAGVAQPVAAARAELEAAASTSGAVLSAILTAAEQIQEIVWTLRDGGLDPRTCDSLDAKASEIYSACSVANLTRPRLEKATRLLRDLETRVGPAHAGTAAADDAPRVDQSAIAAAPHGDAADRVADQQPEAAQPSADAEAAQAQASVAELLRPSLAGVRRRDATIADIARVMGNLIPAASKLSLVGMPPAAVEQHTAHSDAEVKTAAADAAPQEPQPQPQPQPQPDETHVHLAQPQHESAPDASASAVRAQDASPSSIAVDDFSGFIEAWPQDGSEIDADETQIEPPSETVTAVNTSSPADSDAPAREKAADSAKPADPLSSALDSFISRAMGLDKLVKRSVAAAFAHVEVPASTAAPSPVLEAETAPFISKAEQTQTLREAIAHLQAQRATDITPPTQTEAPAQPLLLRDERNDAPPDAPAESLLSQMEATDFDGSMEKKLKAGPAHAITRGPADAMRTVGQPKNVDAVLPAPVSPTRAPAYATALGTADLDDFLFGESAPAHPPADALFVSDAGQEPEPVASNGHAKAKSFAQLLDTSIPWAKGPEPRPVPVKVQAPASVKLDIDIAKESAASGAAYVPDPLARVRALSIDEKTALFG